MKPIIYVETTIISYLAAWPSRDLIIAAHQQITRDWWSTCHSRFEVVASELVVREVSAGDETAAVDRLKIVEPLKLLEITEADLELAQLLVRDAAVPTNAADDALHLALAATNG